MSDFENVKELFDIKTDQIDVFQKNLKEQISLFEGNKNYSKFINQLIQHFIIKMSLEDAKETSKSITALISEKQKLEKKKPIQKKATLKYGKESDKDFTDYGKDG